MGQFSPLPWFERGEHLTIARHKKLLTFTCIYGSTFSTACTPLGLRRWSRTFSEFSCGKDWCALDGVGKTFPVIGRSVAFIRTLRCRHPKPRFVQICFVSWVKLCEGTMAQPWGVPTPVSAQAGQATKKTGKQKQEMFLQRLRFRFYPLFAVAHVTASTPTADQLQIFRCQNHIHFTRQRAIAIPL